jgi:WD domain, G-beta repeat
VADGVPRHGTRAVLALNTILLQVFDAVTCQLAPSGRLAAHRDLIYDLSWSADSSVLASCSSDCTAKVWYLMAAADATAARTRAPSAPSVPFCTVLQHPTYTYSAQMCPFHGSVLAGVQLLATSCADGRVYFWALTADVDQRAPPDGTEPRLRVAAGTGARAPAAALLWDSAPLGKLPGSEDAPRSVGSEDARISGEPRGCPGAEHADCAACDAAEAAPPCDATVDAGEGAAPGQPFLHSADHKSLSNSCCLLFSGAVMKLSVQHRAINTVLPTLCSQHCALNTV